MCKTIKNLHAEIKIYLLILFFFLLVSLFSGIFIGASCHTPSTSSLVPPSIDHWLGTDDLGFDFWAQLCHGTQVSVFIGCATALLAGLGGCILGIVAGYYPGWIDRTITLCSDVSVCLPRFPVIIVFSSFLGSSLFNIIFIMVLLAWAESARVVRAKVLSMRLQGYLRMAKSYGGTFGWLLKKHFIPQLMPIIYVNLLKITSHAIMHEAGLSLLGLGDPTTKSWGSTLNRAMSFYGVYYTDYWVWWILPPLCAICLFVVVLSLLGRKLEELLNPKL